MEGPAGQEGGGDDRQLIAHPGHQHFHGPGRLVAEPGQPQVDGAGEPLPTGVAGQATAQSGMAGDAEHRGEQAEGGDRHDEGDVGGIVTVGQVKQRRIDGEGGQGDERQHHPAGEPLEHDRGERARRLAVLRGDAPHPQHIAAYGGRQEVADEQRRQIGREKLRHPVRKIKSGEHPLPPQRSQGDPDEGGRERSEQQGDRAEIPLRNE